MKITRTQAFNPVNIILQAPDELGNVKQILSIFNTAVADKKIEVNQFLAAYARRLANELTMENIENLPPQ